MEELALKREKDEASKARLAKLREDVAAREQTLGELQRRWEAERASVNRVGKLNDELSELRIRAERAQREGNLEKASRLLYGEIPVIEREVAQAEAAESVP